MDANLTFRNYQPTIDDFRADVIGGLRRKHKQLPSKYFYDQRGCRLFDEICELDEYYPTRTEIGIMQNSAAAMARLIGPQSMIVEFGSGSSIKTRILLDHLDRPAAYVPVDIAADHLRQTASKLSQHYPHVEVLPVCADFTEPFELPAPRRSGLRTVVYFPGSTIGNFERRDSAALLRDIAELCGPGGGLLIGIDLQKDVAVLEAAYNDSRGVTAQFNANLLQRANRELEADFEIDQFDHRAIYNDRAGRIEMLLVSRAQQTVSIGGEQFEFDRGEAICTEYSHKYDLDEFRRFAAECGLEFVRAWTDERQYFAVVYLTTR